MTTEEKMIWTKLGIMTGLIILLSVRSGQKKENNCPVCGRCEVCVKAGK